MEPPPTVLDLARSYVAAGFSVAPIRPDGTKAPAVAWKQYQKRRPSEEELNRWFAAGTLGIAIICGEVSGNLEVLDFDELEAFELWEAAMRKDCPAILGRLPIIATPDNGRHVYYRLPHPPAGNRKLAFGEGPKASVETRGEGGYVLAPGCPAVCHPSGRLYRHIGGPPLEKTPILGAENVNVDL